MNSPILLAGVIQEVGAASFPKHPVATSIMLFSIEKFFALQELYLSLTNDVVNEATLKIIIKLKER